MNAAVRTDVTREIHLGRIDTATRKKEFSRTHSLTLSFNHPLSLSLSLSVFSTQTHLGRVDTVNRKKES